MVCAEFSFVEVDFLNALPNFASEVISCLFEHSAVGVVDKAVGVPWGGFGVDVVLNFVDKIVKSFFERVFIKSIADWESPLEAMEFVAFCKTFLRVFPITSSKSDSCVFLRVVLGDRLEYCLLGVFWVSEFFLDAGEPGLEQCSDVFISFRTLRSLLLPRAVSDDEISVARDWVVELIARSGPKETRA